ncbi:hypothetical protein ScPMuIL_003838 [Solemya velum]
MVSYEMDLQEKRNPKTNKRLFFILCVLLIVLPVVVGVLVWNFTKCEADDSHNNEGITESNRGGEGTTTDTPVVSTTHPEWEIWKNLRLPDYIKPVHYDITLYPDFYEEDKGWFYGNETVEIKISRNTSYILIHINYLNVTRTELFDNVTGDSIPIQDSFHYEPNQFWVIKTKTPVENGTVVNLVLSFDGSLTRAIVGFYKSTYTDSKSGAKRYLASSKFEPVDARRAFPCFDEPNIKAEYTVSLIHKPEYIALSNMPNSTTEWPGNTDLQTTQFERSVKMSTYLVCFIVCDFDYKETVDKNGIKVRVYAAPDRIDQAQYALEVANHTISLYTELFNVTYPLPKLDMIAIPDFISGAMEHWGLITYREVNMLYDEREASSNNKQRCTLVIAHEMAHMWFGNIVTMDWWDDLWLNEGFASFVEYIGAESIQPDWDMMQQFVVDENQPVMVTDAGTSSHPIVVDVEKPSQITEVFDSISYSKGSAVIRMLEVTMGHNTFFEGVKKYLDKYRFSNAKTDDLWAELGTVTPSLPVKSMMDTWTRQMGFPYIKIYAKNRMIIAEQHRFLAQSSMSYNDSESPFRYKWYVPLNYITSTNNETSQIEWMYLNNTQFSSSMDFEATDDAWIKFNHGGTGYYRVLYPDWLWQRFGNLLDRNGPTILPDADRAGLIDDAFNLARGGYLNYSVALDITKYLHRDDDHLPWDSARMGITYIQNMLSGGAFGLWREYILSKSKPVMKRLGWEDKGGHLKKLMRNNLIELTCGYGDEDCIENAVSRFRNWIDNGTYIPPNLRSYVYKYGMQAQGGPNEWDKMWDKYVNETVPQEKIKLLYGLSRTKTKWLLERFLEYAMDDSKVRGQDFFTVITYIGRNPVGHSLVWDWIRENWLSLVKKFEITHRYLGRMVPTIVSNFNTEFQLQQVQAFFDLYPEAGAGARGRVQAIESIKRNIVWVNQYKGIIEQWLENTLQSS